jgi:hypothetical protein
MTMRIQPTPSNILSVKRLLLICLLSTLSFAADYKDATIVELRDATQVGTAEVSNTSTVGPYAKDVPAMVFRCYLTVEIEHAKYSAVFPVNQHFKMSDLSTGDTIPARVDGNKLIIRTPDGKEMKSKIVERTPAK